jgi:hypothetical protein
LVTVSRAPKTFPLTVRKKAILMCNSNGWIERLTASGRSAAAVNSNIVAMRRRDAPRDAGSAVDRSEGANGPSIHTHLSPADARTALVKAQSGLNMRVSWLRLYDSQARRT